MSVTIEFTIPASEFAFGDAFETAPSLAVEIDRLASHSREWVMPFAWVGGLESSAVESLLGADAAVASLDVIDESAEVSYVAIDWGETVTRFVDAVIDGQGLIQEASAVDGTWHFTLKFVERRALSDFHAHFEEWGYPFTMQRINEESVPFDRGYGLTADQRETLLTALELGYFDVPRETQIEELARALGVSTNAVSERLRRATKALTSNTIAVASIDREPP